MILYSKQNIHKWAWWKNKPIFLFCITSGLLFALGMTILSLLIKLIGNPDINIWQNAWPIFAGSFVSVSLFSIILWYQNDDSYRKWIKQKENPS